AHLANTVRDVGSVAHRVRHQSANREITRHRCASDVTHTRRQGHRMKLADFRYWHKADMSGSRLLPCKLSPKSQFRHSAPFQVRGRKASFNGNVSPSFTDASMTPSEVVGLLRMSNGPLALNERGRRAY